MIRNSGGYGNEGLTRIKSINETEKETHALNSAFVKFERYKSVENTFIKFKTFKYRFQALYGKEYISLFDKVDILVSRIMIFSKFLHTSHLGGNHPLQEQIKEWSDTIYEKEGGDLLSAEIEEIIISFEKVCNPILKKYNRRFLL